MAIKLRIRSNAIQQNYGELSTPADNESGILRV
jgi:hypothetical protein